VIVGSSLYDDPTRRDFFESATVHEVAHQWFYNVVGNDQVNAPWLDEALAQYSTYLYFRSAYGEAGARGFADSLEERWERVNRDPKPIGLPVAAYQDREYGAIVYGRGPLFFLALRDQIGEEKMAEFLRRYYADYAWGIATPAGFQALAEEVSGQDLSALFTEWIYP
jgi:aminopeptidase N